MRSAWLAGDLPDEGTALLRPQGPARPWLRRWLVGVGVACVAAGAVVAAAVAAGGGAAAAGMGYASGAVAADAAECSELGVQVLRRGGNAVDAAVAATLCIGVANPHSSGIGGGGFMLIVPSNGSEPEVVDFRETAPAAAAEAMYTAFPECTGGGGGGQGDRSRCPSRLGGLAVATPGELRGLELAHARHGALPWADVVEPAASLAERGYTVTSSLAAAIEENAEVLREDPFMAEAFLPRGRPLLAGERATRPRLSATLRLVAEKGAAAVYGGAVAERLVNATRRGPYEPGVLTAADLAAYRAVVRPALVAPLPAGQTVLGAPPPASGAAAAMALGILAGWGEGCAPRDALSYHRMLEAFRFAYARRTQIADPCCSGAGGCENATSCAAVAAAAASMLDPVEWAECRSKTWSNQTHHVRALRPAPAPCGAQRAAPQDPAWYGASASVANSAGTTHISAMGPEGDAVAVTSTVNLFFGAKVMSADGIVLNNEMDDFGSPGIENAFGCGAALSAPCGRCRRRRAPLCRYPPAPANFIRPGKRPLSSSTPTVVLDADGRAKMVAGASGGSKIITATVSVLRGVLTFCNSLRAAVDEPRLHDQLEPDQTVAEPRFPSELADALQALGHNWTTAATNGVCQAIVRAADGTLSAASDGRRKGGAAAAGF